MLAGKSFSAANGGTLARRPSSGKHYSLSIEAPITRVINIILAAQENQPSYIAQALDKVTQLLFYYKVVVTMCTLASILSDLLFYMF